MKDLLCLWYNQGEMVEQTVNKSKMRWAKALIIGCFVVCVIIFAVILGMMIWESGCECAPYTECLCGLFTMMVGIYALMPMFLDTAFVAYGLLLKRELRKEGTKLPAVYTVLGTITVWQIPLGFAMYLIWFLLMGVNG